MAYSHNQLLQRLAVLSIALIKGYNVTVPCPGCLGLVHLSPDNTLDIHHTEFNGRKDRKGHTHKSYYHKFIDRALFGADDGGTRHTANYELLCRNCHKILHYEAKNAQHVS